MDDSDGDATRPTGATDLDALLSGPDGRAALADLVWELTIDARAIRSGGLPDGDCASRLAGLLELQHLLAGALRLPADAPRSSFSTAIRDTARAYAVEAEAVRAARATLRRFGAEGVAGTGVAGAE